MSRPASILTRLIAVTLVAGCYAPSGGQAEETPQKTPAPATGQARGPVKPATPPQPGPTGPVGVELIPQYDKILASSAHSELNVLLRLEGTGPQSDDPAAVPARPPLDLAIVLDRSGSMQGDKIRAVKQAALELLDKLDARDQVTLVSYSNDVQIHATRLKADSDGKGTLRQALLGLNASGMTALGPAMLQAIEALELHRSETRLAHVMLLSDGLANVGERSPVVLGQRAALAFGRGVSVSTLGVGLDYNEDLMTRLADQGGGRYHFIKEGEQVAQVLDDELKGLVATVARGVELELAPAPGAELVKVFGYPTTTDGGTSKIRIGALGADQKREVIIRLRVPGGSDAKRATLDLGKLAVHFADVAADGERRRVDVPLAVELTDDPAEMQASERKEVTVRVAEVESSEQLEVAARAADEGNFDAAGSALQMAIDDLEEKAQKLPPSPKLRKQIADLKEARGEIGQARRSARARKEYTKKYKAKAYRKKK